MASAGAPQHGSDSGASGGESASIEALNALCARSPDRVEPRIALARALLRVSRAAEALIPAEQAVALAPQLAAALEARGAVIAALQAGDPKLVTLEMAAVLEPANADAHLSVGQAYVLADRPHDAERHFKQALGLGRARDAHVELATLYLSVGMIDAAEHHALAVLSGEDNGEADDTVAAMAHQTLASVLTARGFHDASAKRLDQAYTRQSLFRQPAADSAFTTLVLVTRQAGNVPYASLLPSQRFDRVVWYMEHARPGQIAQLPPYDVVLNAIGDADIAMASADAVDGFLGQSGKPILNPPSRIQATFRHRIRDTLAGIADVVAPLTVRLSAAQIAADGLAEAVDKAGLTGPMIVRPVGSHGGAGMVLAHDAAALKAIDVGVGADAYVSQFVDYRSPDGFHRKYRVIFVDRKAFPYHLAIGRHWMVHHQTSDMADDDLRKAEELGFLRNPTATIGARAWAAIEAIGRRLDLDYGGIDFAVTADGQVLVFETNATMLTHLEPADGPFAAKNPFIQPIIDAFQARLETLAFGGST